MPLTADDCSKECWPRDPQDRGASMEHDKCTDSGCNCACHKWDDRAEQRERRIRRYEDRPGPLRGHRGMYAHLDP